MGNYCITTTLDAATIALARLVLVPFQPEVAARVEEHTVSLFVRDTAHSIYVLLAVQHSEGVQIETFPVGLVWCDVGTQLRALKGVKAQQDARQAAN